MGALLAVLLGALPKLVEAAQGLWDKFGEKLALRWDAARDQRLRDEKATLEATVEAQQKALEAKQALDTERAKEPERGTRAWWEKGSLILLVSLLVSSCAMLARPPLPVAPARVLLARPAFPNLTELQQAWLAHLVQAYEENCTTLASLGGQRPAEAARTCVVK